MDGVSSTDAPRSPKPWIGFLAALQFLTILPPLIRRQFTPKELGAAVGWFPGVGALVGLCLAIADPLLALVLPQTLRAGFVLAIWVLLTGALHLDGVLDTCDGLFGGWTPDKRLEILRDERIGAYALVGGILLMLLKFSALLSLQPRWEALLLAPILGRWSMSLSIVVFPYARAQGLGREMKEHAGWQEAVFASGLALFVAWIVGQQLGLIALASAAVAMLLIAFYAMRTIQGLTGDIYGAINEVVELVVLVTVVIFQQLY